TIPPFMKNSVAIQQDLLRFKLAVLNSPEFTSKDSILGAPDGDVSIYSNRGNKLLYSSEGVDYTRLNAHRDDLGLVNVDELDPETGEKRARLVIRSKTQSVDDIIQRQLDEEFGQVDEEENYRTDFDSVNGLFDSVDVAGILAPITHPA
ncbi:hypothetical protein WICPIJ_003916, partial [Wickerhamomyces pijperi]